MLRLAVALNAVEGFTLSCANLQFVRWAKRPVRKPLGSPPAKSKLFRVPVRPTIPEDEDFEMKRLMNNYRTQMKSLKKYLASKYTTDITELVDEQKRRVAFEEDFARCVKINEEWNNQVETERKEFFENELMKQIEYAQQRLKMQEEILREKREQAEKIVREVKEKAKTFVTSENIDDVIEYALANPTDYNYSIDLEGNYYYGRNTKSHKENQDNEEIHIKQ